ncbi:MAG: propionyl-CoA synthetase [Gammaproteobacteria bacterium]|jgi:propionyl-CoA synthetase|nr:propionyl-CoA synthetase [Gammaproteobacteria bacterium]MBT3725173.1 propionyl-CoA synthetase [Gammaproteobacteria bacterium]MBT4076717.1 propionyl-CoA synthetase [Gammaproteobacteria bacterium]MBT4196139.1 propionyl-CoA synthetase [Gammaproteobacteria bacterium]MBT4450469.1 propionyl-CoA synthetase [Gammaproteobacteria bacterium]
MTTYNEIYQQSLNDPDAFWGKAAEELHWTKKWDKVIDLGAKPVPHWFVGGQINTCYNAVDRHVETGRADQTAIIYDSPITNQQRKISYSELLQQVSQFAGVLVNHGAKKGDRVIIYMPMIPEAAIAMLACARIGAIHSVVFGGFAANELATRIDDAKPDIIISTSCGIEPARVIEYKPLLDAAIDQAKHKVSCCILKARPQAKAEMIEGRDFDWDNELTKAESVDCVPLDATDPLYILYTSGTTGEPKGVIRDNGGHAVAMHWSMKNVYNVEPGDVYWAASDVGWVVGHSYIVYAPLLKGCTTIMYEGKPVGTPDPGAFWRVISEHNVKVLFTAPTAFRAIKKEDPDGEYLKKYDLSCMQSLFLAGERCDPDTLFWARDKLGKPVIDHWWQTETGWAIASNPLGIENMEIKAGSPTVAMPGYDVQILSEDGNEMPTGEMGNIVIKLPMPPSCLPSLWGNDQRFIDAYLTKYEGYYLTGDAGFKDEDDYLWIMSRTDDVINVAGHRLSTGAMEEVLSGHSDIAECAVIGVADDLKGQMPLGLIVLKAGVDRTEADIVKELVQRVRDQIGPVAAFKQAKIVNRLPKTRSGKILRGTMVNIADGTEWKMPATIDDPVILDEITEALQVLGYAKK